MADQEEDIRKLEDQFPAMSGSAFADASRRALASEQSVLRVEFDTLYQYLPDGSKLFIKKIAPPIPSYPGKKIIITSVEK